MVECENKTNDLLLGIVTGGFAVFLFMQLLWQLQLINQRLSYLAPVTYQPALATSSLSYQPPKTIDITATSLPAQKEIFAVEIDADGLIVHKDI